MLPGLVSQLTPHYNLIIGHFLGVDHAGHIFGVNSTEMQRKLAETDDTIGEIIDMVDKGAEDVNERTLVLVFGDHGQTLSGDHGGGMPRQRLGGQRERGRAQTALFKQIGNQWLSALELDFPRQVHSKK